MLQYLIILLDETSASYCHYPKPERNDKLISIEDLKEGILYAMKENLTIQFVYPVHPVPPEYNDIIETIDHVKIKPVGADLSDADIVIIDNLSGIKDLELDIHKSYVLRIGKEALYNNVEMIASLLPRVARLNVTITDIDSFSDEDFRKYKEALGQLGLSVKNHFVSGLSPQINLLTDRMILDRMNNCSAGDTNITLAPDGRFYPCPAFFYEVAETKYMGLGGPEQAPFSVGDLKNGLNIKNAQLYKIDHAPLCRKCDAYQCKRCIWLNWKMTREVNTPSHEQCVIAHLERNASRQLLVSIRELGSFLPEQDIPEINYLDPFDTKDDW